jgi:hypothetical protein
VLRFTSPSTSLKEDDAFIEASLQHGVLLQADNTKRAERYSWLGCSNSQLRDRTYTFLRGTKDDAASLWDELFKTSVGKAPKMAKLLKYRGLLLSSCQWVLSLPATTLVQDAEDHVVGNSVKHGPSLTSTHVKPNQVSQTCFASLPLGRPLPTAVVLSRTRWRSFWQTSLNFASCQACGKCATLATDPSARACWSPTTHLSQTTYSHFAALCASCRRNHGQMLSCSRSLGSFVTQGRRNLRR